MNPPRTTKPMASFKSGKVIDVTESTDNEFDTRKTHVFNRGPDGALVPVLVEPPPPPPPVPEPVPGPPPRGMAVQSQIEAFRDLRTKLLQIAAGLKLQRFTVLVVPISAGAGASFVARNLAAAFALQEQGSSLLIDCDFRRPAQAVAMNRDVEGDGLSDYLDHAMAMPPLFHQPAAALERLLAPTTMPGLRIIPAGRCEATRAGRPREYFSSSAMHGLMAVVRELPGHVVLDGPALDASPDALILSALADFVVLVVGYNQATHADIVKAAEAFDRAKFAGVVFNERTAGNDNGARRRKR